MESTIIGLRLLLSILSIQVAHAENPVTFNELPAALQRVALCESHARQSARGPYGEVGIFQIHPKYHLKSARALGLDIYNPNDNMAYALILFEKNGLKDWESSRACWK